MDEVPSSARCQKTVVNSYEISMDWTNLLNNEKILIQVGRTVVVEGLCDVEIVITQTMRRSLGEIETVSSTARMLGRSTI